MNLTAIYAITASGLRIRKSLFGGLSSQTKRMLELVDGHKSLADIFKLLKEMPEAKRVAAFEQLEKDGYIKYLTESKVEDDEEWALDTVFAPMVVEEVDTLEEIESSLALDAALLTQLEERQRLDEVRKTQEIEAQIRAKEQAKLEVQAKKMAQLALQQKNEMVEREVLASQAQVKEQARIAAEQTQHALAHAKALEEAAAQVLKTKALEAAKLIAEEQARLDAEEKIRFETQQAIRHAEEKQKREQDNLLKAKLEAQALVDKIHAKEQARREQVRMAREAEAAQRKADEEAKVAEKARQAEQLLATLAAEKIAKAEAEERAIAEAKERGRLEGERILRQEKEAQQKLAAQAQARAEEEARLMAEQLAAEEQLIAETKERERLEAERLARDALEAQQRLATQVQAKAAEEARLIAMLQAEKMAAEERAAAALKEQARVEAEQLAQAAAERQRQLDAQMRAEAQEQARLAAQKEADARAKAKEEARIEKARLAQQKAEEVASIKQQALARKEAERIAKADKKAALKAEKISQQLAKKSAKEAASLLEDDSTEIVSWKVLEAQAKRKKSRSRILRFPSLLPKIAVKKCLVKCAKLVLVYIPILALVLLGLMHVLNLRMLIEPIQTLASAYLGEPVVVGEVRASVWPQPHLVLNQVRVGKNAALNIQSVQVFPAVDSLFEDGKVINSMLVDGMDIDQNGFSAPMQWLASANKTGQLTIQAIHFNHVTLRIRDVELGRFDGQVTKNTAQHWHGFEMNNAEKSIFATIMPLNESYQLMVTGQRWPLPFKSAIVFDSIKMQGIYQQNKLSFNQINGEILGGTFTSTATLNWADGWQLTGDFKLNQANTDEVFKTFGSANFVDGKLTFSGKLSSQSHTFSALADAMRVNGNFEILDSKINGIDLPRTIATPADRSLEGYATNFDQLTGNLQVNNAHFVYRNLVLKSPKLQAKGQLEVDAEHRVSGKIIASLMTSSRRFQEHLNLTGTVDNVKRQ
jgi:hypothetical protein